VADTPAKRTLAPDDIYSFRWVSDPQVSPCGARVAYVETRIEDKKYRSAIWMVPAAGGDPDRFTNGPKADKSPRWSPDGSKLAFVSDRDGTSQIWLMDTDGGEASRLTGLKSNVGDINWSPDGKRIAFISKWAPADDEKPDPEKEKEKSDCRVITRLHHKADGKGFWDGKYSHIYTVDVAGGETKRITCGEFDHTNPAWSPEGSLIAFVANRTADADYTNVKDVWVVPSEGGEPRRVTPGYGPCESPTFSPDGRQIAFFGHDNTYRGATLTSLWAIPVGGGEPARVTGDIEIGGTAGTDCRYGDNPVKPLWSKCGHCLMFIAADGGTSNVYKVDLQTGNVTRMTTGTHTVYGFSMTAGVFALAIAGFANPGDIWAYAMPAGAWTRLTGVNRAFLDGVHLSEPERIQYKAYDGWDIEGWLMKPVGFLPGVKYPMILEIHGGPHSAYGASFFIEFQLFAANGYAVLFTNPRGSHGYGQEFVAATKLDWGGGDYRDIMAGVDYAVSLGWIDQKRMGVTGGSYGGYMTNWVIGHTDRFAAAVSNRSTCNRMSHFGNSDIGYFNGDYEYPGPPWESPDFYLAHSPITFVKNITTPVLLMQSENDYRCPISQAEEFFVALKYLRKTVEFVRFPNEGHELSRSGQPVHRVERLCRMVGWFNKYIARNSSDYTF